MTELSKNQLKWLGHYNSLCSKAKSRGLDKKLLNGYFEVHHIQPKCLGGSNDSNNLILLTAEEHFVAHQLLIKIYPHESKLLFAAKAMATWDSTGHRVNNKFFGWIRRKTNKYLKTQNKQNNERIAEAARRKTGQNKTNNASIARMAELKTGRTKYTNETVAKMAKTKTGQTAANHDGIRRRAEKIRGRTAENYSYLAESGKKHAGRTKENSEYRRRQSVARTGWTKDTHAGTAAQSAKMKGRSKSSHCYIAENAEKANKLTKELRQLLVFAKNSGISFTKFYKYLDLADIIHYSALPQIFKREVNIYITDEELTDVKIKFNSIFGDVNQNLG